MQRQASSAAVSLPAAFRRPALRAMRSSFAPAACGPRARSVPTRLRKAWEASAGAMGTARDASNARLVLVPREALRERTSAWPKRFVSRPSSDWAGVSARTERGENTCRGALAVAELGRRLYEEPAALADIVDEVDVCVVAVLGGLDADGVGAEEAGRGECAGDGGGGVEHVAEGGVWLCDEVRGEDAVEEGARGGLGAENADGGEPDRRINQLDHGRGVTVTLSHRVEHVGHVRQRQGQGRARHRPRLRRFLRQPP